MFLKWLHKNSKQYQQDMAFDPTISKSLYCRWHVLPRSLQRLPASTSNWHQKKSALGFVAWLRVLRRLPNSHGEGGSTEREVPLNTSHRFSQLSTEFDDVRWYLPGKWQFFPTASDFQPQLSHSLWASRTFPANSLRFRQIAGSDQKVLP